MPGDNDGVNDLSWVTDTQLLDELEKRYASIVFAGVKDWGEADGKFWHRMTGCPFRVKGLAEFVDESAAHYLFHRVPPDTDSDEPDEGEDWKRG